MSLSTRSTTILFVLLGGAMTLSSCSGTAGPADATASTPASREVSADLAAIEEEHGVTIGVSAHTADATANIEYRADDRFGYASTVKTFVASALLSALSPAERSATVTWTQAEIDAAGYSPVTSAHVADGLTLDELAEAAVRESDYTATNLVMQSLGGPEAVQAHLRLLGDDSTVVSQREPDLNTVVPGQDVNTTTPAAFASALREAFEGDVLSAAGQDTLMDWMSGNATGDALIRAGAPPGWIVADKSGGAGGIRNDLAVATPPDGEPVYLAILTTTDDPDADYDDVVIEETARVVLAALG